MMYNSWQKCVNMLADDIYLVISPHMIDNCRTAIVIWRRGCQGEKGGDGRLWVCRCAIVKDVCVVCVSLLYLLDLCGDMFAWVGMCLIVYFWGLGGGSLSHMWGRDGDNSHSNYLPKPEPSQTQSPKWLGTSKLRMLIKAKVSLDPKICVSPYLILYNTAQSRRCCVLVESRIELEKMIACNNCGGQSKRWPLQTTSPQGPLSNGHKGS